MKIVTIWIFIEYLKKSFELLNRAMTFFSAFKWGQSLKVSDKITGTCFYQLEDPLSIQKKHVRRYWVFQWIDTSACG